MAMAEAWIHAQGDFATVSGGSEIADHARRSDVRQNVVLQDDLQGVVAEDIGSEADHRRLLSGSVASMQGAEDFVAGNGIDPNAGSGHFLENLRSWASLHGEPGLNAFAGRDGFDSRDAGTDDAGIIEPERRACGGGDSLEEFGGMGHC